MVRLGLFMYYFSQKLVYAMETKNIFLFSH